MTAKNIPMKIWALGAMVLISGIYVLLYFNGVHFSEAVNTFLTMLTVVTVLVIAWPVIRWAGGEIIERGENVGSFVLDIISLFFFVILLIVEAALYTFAWALRLIGSAKKLGDALHQLAKKITTFRNRPQKEEE